MNRPLYPLPLVTAGGGARVPVDAASQGVLLSPVSYTHLTLPTILLV